MEFTEEELLDPCCAKEARDQKKSAEIRSRLQAVDITRIAVQRRLQALGTSSYTISNQRCVVHGQGCDHANVALCEACEETDAYASDDSNLSDDLDSMLDGFSLNKDSGATNGRNSDNGDNGDNDDNDDNDDDDGTKDYGDHSFDTNKNKPGTSPLYAPISLEVLSPDQLSHAFRQREFVVFLLVTSFDGKTTTDSFVDGVAARMSSLAIKYDLTSFAIAVQPKDADCRRFGVDRLPSLVCCMDKSVVARATRLEQFRGRDKGGADIGERLDPWFESCRMIGRMQQSPASLARARADSLLDDHDDEDLQASSAYCDKDGCTKTFHHTHIATGMGINAQDLSVL